MPPFQRNIQHIVVLMLENRSFDHMLGFLGTPHGLTGTEFNVTDPANPVTKVTVSNDATYTGDLDVDPSHALPAVNEQLFGTLEAPSTMPPPDRTNIGFVLNYGHQPNVTADRAAHIMKCFAPERLPVLSTLAREFAVCDRWFSSLPAQTWPNRFFAHAATSMGFIDNQVRIYSARTIYDNLSMRDEDWSIYFHDIPQALMLESLRKSKFRKNFKVFSDRFKLDCHSGLLPSYSFIEPRYFDFLDARANDQHPPHDVALGEHLIADVYETIRNSPAWDTTLLVIVWDEHGGIFDHLQPGPAVNPDNLVHEMPSFDFRRLGLRVPAVLVSPYIARGTVDSTVYDHTSVLASLKELFDLPEFLTARDAAAPTFGHLITDTRRTDTPTQLTRPAPLSGQTVVVATREMSDETLRSGSRAAVDQELSEFQQSLVDLAKTLEGTDRPRARAARLAAVPTNEHAGAVHVRLATEQFLAAGR